MGVRVWGLRYNFLGLLGLKISLEPKGLEPKWGLGFRG